MFKYVLILVVILTKNYSFAADKILNWKQRRTL